MVEDADSDDNGSLFLPQDDTDSPSPTATKKSIEKHGVESPAQARTRTASFASFRSVWSRSHAPGPQTPSARGPGSVVSSAPKTKMAAPARANTSLKMTPTKPASQAPKPAAKRLKNAKQLTFLRKLTEDQLLVGFTADELWDNFGKEAVMNESYKKDDIIRAMTDGHIAKATEAFEAARGVAKIGQASTSKNKASSSPKKAMKAPNPPKPKTDFKEFLHKGVVAFDLCTPEPEDDIAEQFANAATTLNLASQPAAASEIVELDAPASNSNGRLGSFPASSIHWDEDSNTRRASEQAIESTSSIEVDMTENVIPSVETTEQNSPAGEVEMVDEAAPVVQHNKEQTIIEINEVSDDDMPTIQDLTKKAEQQKAPINSETSASDIQKPNNSDPTGSGSVFQDTKFVNGDTEMMDFEQGATILSAGSIAGRTRALSVESSTTETTKAAASNDINAHDAFQTGPATSVAAPVGEVQPKSAAGTDIVATENNPRNAAVPALDDAHDDETEDLLADVRRRILEMEETPQQTLTESLEAKSPEVEAHAAADNDEDASLSQSEICSTVSAPAIDVPAIKINDPYSDIESMSPSNQLFNEMPFTAPAPTSGAETPTADSEGEFERLVAAAREDPQGFRSKFDVDSQKLYAKLSQASVSSSGSEKGDEIVENNADAHVGSEDLMDIDSSSQNANEPNDGIINTDDLSQKDVETANAAEVAASIALSETPSTIRTKFINGSVPSGDSSPSKPTPMSQKRDRSAVETETERLLAEETPSKKMKALDLNDAAIPSSLGEKGNDEKK